MNKVKIRSIKKEHYKGKVYNLELDSNSQEPYEDDLFWIEQNTGIVTHNCFPKDINAMIATMEEKEIDPLVLKAVWEQNTKVRSNWDWACNSSAVRKENE